VVFEADPAHAVGQAEQEVVVIEVARTEGQHGLVAERL
jgi:hypothetical protein